MGVIYFLQAAPIRSAHFLPCKDWWVTTRTEKRRKKLAQSLFSFRKD